MSPYISEHSVELENQKICCPPKYDHTDMWLILYLITRFVFPFSPVLMDVLMAHHSMSSLDSKSLLFPNQLCALEWAKGLASGSQACVHNY
jgi:hypothetical protein